MAGLIEKDIRLVWCSRQTLFLFLLIAVVIEFSQSGTFILGYLPFAVIILLVNTIAYDELDKGYEFLMTLPFDAKMYVKEKYIFCFLGGAVSWVLAVLFYFGFKVVHGELIAFGDEMLMTTAFLPVIVVLLAVLLPMQIKFGVEKSRGVIAGVCGAIGALALAFAKLVGHNEGDSIFAFFSQMNKGLLFGITAIIMVLLTILSYAVSVRIMKKKEF